MIEPKIKQEMPQPQAQNQPREQYGCIPAQTLEEIRAEIRETSPGITDEEFEALGF
jgi:hypothetical protein